MLYILCCFGQNIPPTFITKIQGEIANNVILRDRYKNTWPVEVATSGERLYFSKGWTEFCSANCVEQGDFMVFKYQSEKLFRFKLFGANACVGAQKIKDEVKTDDDSMAEEEDDEEEEEEEEEE